MRSILAMNSRSPAAASPMNDRRILPENGAVEKVDRPLSFVRSYALISLLSNARNRISFAPSGLVMFTDAYSAPSGLGMRSRRDKLR